MIDRSFRDATRAHNPRFLLRLSSPDGSRVVWTCCSLPDADSIATLLAFAVHSAPLELSRFVKIRPLTIVRIVGATGVIQRPFSGRGPIARREDETA
jgi:hypothetical protein